MFIEGQVYKRSEIHDTYGGSRQSGISPSAEYPYIFIFSGSTGEKHGYQDGWENPNVFSYIGEGQRGDMSFKGGNIALRDHLRNGKRVFLFEFIQKAYWMFIGEMECFDFAFGDILDTDGQIRQGIRFFFKRRGIALPDLDAFTKQDLSLEESTPNKLDEERETERKSLITSRVGHGDYRKRLIHRWEYKCAVTGFNNPKILIASHIVPWKESSNKERLDVNNGILLSPVYDALFDRNLISFENSGEIILSDVIEYGSYTKIGLTGKEVISSLKENNFIYLEKHRERLVQPT